MCTHSKLYSILLYKVPSCLIFYLLNLFFGIFIHIYAASDYPTPTFLVSLRPLTSVSPVAVATVVEVVIITLNHGLAL